MRKLNGFSAFLLVALFVALLGAPAQAGCKGGLFGGRFKAKQKVVASQSYVATSRVKVRQSYVQAPVVRAYTSVRSSCSNGSCK